MLIYNNIIQLFYLYILIIYYFIYINIIINSNYLIVCIYFLKFAFTFSHLADCFYPKRLTNEDNGSNQNQQVSIRFLYRKRIEQASVRGLFCFC